MEGVLMTGMASHNAAYSQPTLPDHIARITAQINFAPIAPARKEALKSWERQPSTAFLARHKSRKIWKRFRKSMEALRERRVAAAPSLIEESEFLREISQSANAAYVRAVKRLRLRKDDDSNNNRERGSERGRRSFLETKWELETCKKKRKMVTLLSDEGFVPEEQLVESCHDVENEADYNANHTTQPSLEESPLYVALNTAVGAVESSASEDDNADQGAIGNSEIDGLAADAHHSSGTTTEEVRELIAKQETTLVRSALRMNSLDGEDAALLSEFLSRAQAKRAANAAMVSSESKSEVTRKDANVYQKSEENMHQQHQQAAVVLGSPAVQSRRVLEELDVNSPSIQKQSTPSPVKADKSPQSPNAPELGEETASPTIACRRSTRTKTSKAHQTRSLRPAVPNQIPVRRANGTEFVFLQRTEAQELALTTRKNTRRNKGNSVSPKYMLPALNKERSDGSVSVPQTEGNDQDLKPARHSPRKHGQAKQVWWRDDKLVEYAPEKTFLAIDSPSPGQKSSTSHREGSKAVMQENAQTAHTLPSTPSKKVRKINMAAMSNSSNTTETTSKPLPAGTPIAKRKKLTPKLPRGSSAAPTATTELPPSHHSSKTASAATVDSKTASGKKNTRILGSQHNVQKASSIPRSKTLAKAPTPSSSAGATPMVKRVRPRRAAV